MKRCARCYNIRADYRGNRKTCDRCITQLLEYQKNKPRKFKAKKPSIKVKARDMVHTAVRYGKMKKQPCEHCGIEKVEAHHDDYKKPLMVRWVCRPYHEDIHHG